MFASTSIHSEIGRLRAVVIHKPGLEIELVPIERAAEWLFDDVLWLKKAQEEYDDLHSVLKAVVGDKNLYDLSTLLGEVLTAYSIDRERLLGHIVEIEHIDRTVSKELSKLSGQELADTLIRGSLPSEPYKIVFPPTPNIIFTRDLAAVVGQTVIVGRARKPARQRETLLMRTIVNNHLLFSKLNPIVLEIPCDQRFWHGIDATIYADKPDPESLLLSIEGGDFMVFNKDTAFLGCGERTTAFSATMLAKKLFEANVVTDLFRVDLAKKRASMHLDTIFTMVDNDEFVADMRYAGEHSLRKLPVTRMQQTAGGGLKQQHFASLEEAIRSLVTRPKWISCGGDEPLFQSREQWCDAANFLALAPGVVIGYDRNEKTLKEMQNAGYSVETAADFVTRLTTQGDAALQKKTVITIRSHELSRARGGARCLTQPIHRDPIGAVTSLPEKQDKGGRSNPPSSQKDGQLAPKLQRP